MQHTIEEEEEEKRHHRPLGGDQETVAKLDKSRMNKHYKLLIKILHRVFA